MRVGKRLQAVVQFLDVSDSFIDIGSDHAYIPILMASQGCKKILATEIQLADGLCNVSVEDYDTLVIAGMGYFTIEHILKDQKKLKNIKKMILQSNNHLKELRMFLNEIGYALSDESVVYEAGHYYTIMQYVKEDQTLTEVEYLYGLYKEENKSYYQFLNQEIQSLLEKVPMEKRKLLLQEQALLQTYL